MFKIPLGDLEEAKKNPSSYRAKYEGKKRNGMAYSIYMVLRNAVFEFHKNSSYQSAMNYLETNLERFSNRTKCEDAVDQLQWYIDEYSKLRWPLIQTRKNIVVPLSTQFLDSLKVSGQISRLDMHPDGGYVAWLFRSKGSDGWINQLQMPIIQNAIGVEMGRIHKARVYIGIISFGERYIDTHEFNEGEVKQAHLDLETIFRQMGY